MKENNLRTKKYLFLTILTTSNIVASLIICFSILEKTKEFRKNIGEMGEVYLSLNNYFYLKKDSDKRFFIKYEDMIETLEIIRSSNNISEVIPEYGITGGASEKLYRKKSWAWAISKGISAGYDKLMGLTIKEGRFLKKGDEESEVCVISQNLAKELDAKVSDTVKYMGKELKIIGIVAEVRPFDINLLGSGGNIYIYLPLKIERQLHLHQLHKDALNDKVTYIEEIPYMEGIPLIGAYLICAPGKSELAYQEVINLLKNKYGKDKEFVIGQEATPLLALKFQKILWTVGLLFILGISLLINRKSLSVFLLLTYPCKNQAFLVKTCLLTAIGGLLGVVLGGGICHYLMIEPKISILSIFISLSIGIMFGLLVAIRTSKKLRIEVKK